MAPRRVLVTILAAAAFVALLLYGTLSSQKAECFVVTDYNGGRDSATASAANETDAERQARDTACGTLAHGMSEKILCSQTPPAVRRCRTL